MIGLHPVFHSESMCYIAHLTQTHPNTTQNTTQKNKYLLELETKTIQNTKHSTQVLHRHQLYHSEPVAGIDRARLCANHPLPSNPPNREDHACGQLELICDKDDDTARPGQGKNMKKWTTADGSIETTSYRWILMPNWSTLYNSKRN